MGCFFFPVWTYTVVTNDVIFALGCSEARDGSIRYIEFCMLSMLANGPSLAKCRPLKTEMFGCCISRHCLGKPAVLCAQNVTGFGGNQLVH